MGFPSEKQMAQLKRMAKASKLVRERGICTNKKGMDRQVCRVEGISKIMKEEELDLSDIDL